MSQSGRYLRQFLYEGFNEDDQGRMVFDGVIDEVGGAGRGSFNYRFGQASRDAEEFFNVFYPADMFPFTDGVETDPVLGKTDSLMAQAEARHVRPKLLHIFSNSEYFNRAGSLIHTDVTGTRDIAPPPDSRIYFVSSGPHAFGPFPPVKAAGAAALNNPVSRNPITRALLKDLDQWVVDGTAPPPSRIPHIADGTLVPTAKAGWPVIPGVHFPVPYLKTYRLDFGPLWSKGIVVNEPPKIGQIYVGLVPAVDANGNSRAGIRCRPSKCRWAPMAAGISATRRSGPPISCSARWAPSILSSAPRRSASPAAIPGFRSRSVTPAATITGRRPRRWRSSWCRTACCFPKMSRSPSIRPWRFTIGACNGNNWRPQEDSNFRPTV